MNQLERPAGEQMPAPIRHPAPSRPTQNPFHLSDGAGFYSLIEPDCVFLKYLSYSVRFIYFLLRSHGLFVLFHSSLTRISFILASIGNNCHWYCFNILLVLNKRKKSHKQTKKMVSIQFCWALNVQLKSFFYASPILIY